jgi:hypothetical protein
MKPALPTHVFAPDGLPDRRGGPQGCQHCPMPERHPVHRLPAVDADVQQAEARRLGESEDQP